MLNPLPPLQSDATLYRRTWRTLQLFNIFRIFLAGAFVLLPLIELDSDPLISFEPALFKATSLFFLLFSIAGMVAIYRRQPNFDLQVYLYAVVDIIVITLLSYATGSSNNNLEILLIITIAGTALLLPKRGSNLIAAIATITLLIKYSYTSLHGDVSVNYTQAGILGATFFATALLTTTLTKRLWESEQLAEQRGVDLANLAQLNEHVIQLLQSGVLVIDNNEKIHLINQSAWQLLGMPIMDSSTRLKQISAELSRLLAEWKTQHRQPSQAISPEQSFSSVIPRFSFLGDKPDHGILIFLEDASELAQQAQQLKLASLGQLTASIAHEIRNPLGAISHAAQLLEESPHLDRGDTRLIEIIQQHSSRVNTIIENILQLSRRDRFSPISLQLKPWLDEFIDEFTASQGVDSDNIACHIEPETIQIFMDASQLHQVLWNLCQNGLRHSQDYPHQPKLEIIGGLTPDINHPYLDVLDHGSGIPPELASHIFEPFYTTETGGTGLGLYIARELCECNRAKLEYIAPPRGGSCFRITFSSAEIKNNDE